jgi:hypothetical protein
MICHCGNSAWTTSMHTSDGLRDGGQAEDALCNSWLSISQHVVFQAASEDYRYDNLHDRSWLTVYVKNVGKSYGWQWASLQGVRKDLRSLRWYSTYLNDTCDLHTCFPCISTQLPAPCLTEVRALSKIPDFPRLCTQAFSTRCYNASKSLTHYWWIWLNLLWFSYSLFQTDHGLILSGSHLVSFHARLTSFDSTQPLKLTLRVVEEGSRALCWALASYSVM